jgi:hypothetical protein
LWAAATFSSSACRETPIARNGPTQQRVISRVYGKPASELRAAILDRFAKAGTALPPPLNVLEVSGQPPPGFAPDWLAGYVDPGGFLEPYRRLPLAERVNDLVLREATGDQYWLSEYEANGQPVPFYCALIVHFVERRLGETEVQVFELVPTVWVGKHWAVAKEGIGIGRFRDIRFVEPTVRDREAVLRFIDGL